MGALRDLCTIRDLYCLRTCIGSLRTRLLLGPFAVVHRKADLRGSLFSGRVLLDPSRPSLGLWSSMLGAASTLRGSETIASLRRPLSPVTAFQKVEAGASSFFYSSTSDRNTPSMSVPAYLKASSIALITGAAQGGIGFEIASIALKRHSMKAVLVDKSKAALDATAKSLVASGVPEEQFETKIVDVADPKQVQDLADEVFSQYGKVDFLVLNAGTSVPSKSFGGDLESWTCVDMETIISLTVSNFGTDSRFELPSSRIASSCRSTLAASSMVRKRSSSAWSRKTVPPVSSSRDRNKVNSTSRLPNQRG